MCQVLRGQLGLFDGGVDLRGECVESAVKRGWDGGERGQRGGEAGAQETIVGAGEEQGDAEAEVGDAVREAAWGALDQTMQAQAAELIGDGALGDGERAVAGEGGEMRSQIGG